MERIAPAAHNQKDMWIQWRTNPNYIGYNLELGIHFISPVDIDLLKQASQHIIDRQEILRTTFFEERGILWQKIHSHWPVPFVVIDANQLSDAQIRQDIFQVHSQRYDLERGPLFGIRVYRCSPTSTIFVTFSHHIVFDAWSFGLFYSELSIIYEKLLSGNVFSLSPLKKQYRDFVEWQNRFIETSVAKQQLSFWKEILREQTPKFQLPQMRKSISTNKVMASNHCPFKIPKRLLKSIERLNVKAATTFHVFFLSVFYILLHHYTQQEEIALGLPSAGRQRNLPERAKEDFADTFGFFLNPTIMPIKINPYHSFLELLQYVTRFTQEIRHNQDYPLLLLVEQLQLTQFPSISYVFQKKRPQDDHDIVSLTFDLPKRERLTLGPFVCAPFFFPTQREAFDLTLWITVRDDNAYCHFTYKDSIFSRNAIGRGASHYKCIIDTVLQNPQIRIADICLLSLKERKLLFNDFNRTAAPYPKEKTLAELFIEQATLYPQAIAVIFNDQQLTYRQLDRLTTDFANHLQQLNVGPDKLVAVCLDRSVELIIALLGIIKAGGAYVPIEPTYPQARIDYIVEDTQAALIITQSRFLSYFKEYQNKLFLIDEYLPDHQQDKDASIKLTATSKNLAYVMYTSGSTGRPKGVACHHAGVVNRLLWMQKQYPLTASDRILQKTPYSFDVSVWEFFWPLITGSCLVIANPGIHKDPRALAEIIKQYQITIIHFVPSMLHAFLATIDGINLSSLRHVFCSGEELPTAYSHQLIKQLPQALVHNLYGPTEASIDVTYWQCKLSDNHFFKTTPIGKPIQNMRVYILNQHLQPVPIGIVGELYLAGIGLARGYFNRSELTAEKFINSPFAEEERLYKTGDLGRYLEDGNIEFFGRYDQQVKIRGLRIELGEIEATIRQNPQVKHAIVLVKENSNNMQQLLAYVIPQSTDLNELQQQQLLNRLKIDVAKQLPDYMIPNLFTIIKTLPLTPSGKLDRNALPPPVVDLPADDKNINKFSQQEQRIAMIWSEILAINADVLSADTDFFALGGHSLSFIHMINRINHDCGCTLNMVDVMKHPTIRDLATMIARYRSPISPIIISINDDKNNYSSPLFLVHPIGGTALPYRSLAKLSRRIYGINNPYLGTQEKFNSLEAMADYYITAIKTVQTRGPYYLGGWSLGGNIALAMAHRLKDLGEDIAQIILIDSINHSSLPATVFTRELLAKLICLEKGEDYRQDSAKFATEITEREKLLPLFLNYHFPSYDGKVTLLKAQLAEPLPIELSNTYLQTDSNGWQNILAQLQVISIPGSHSTLFDTKYIGTLIDALNKSIQ